MLRPAESYLLSLQMLDLQGCFTCVHLLPSVFFHKFAALVKRVPCNLYDIIASVKKRIS